MCRWLAYSGSPNALESLLYRSKHSLIDQGRHARLAVPTEKVNGDGFGIGWWRRLDLVRRRWSESGALPSD